MELGSAAVRLSPEGEAEVVWGRRLDPARIEVLSHPAAVLRAALGRGRAARRGAARRADHGRPGTRTPSSTRSSCGRPSPVPTWVVLLEAATEADRDALEQLAADAGFAAEDWSSSVRLLCRMCSESRMPSDEGDGEHLDPHDHSEPGHPGPLGHRTDGAAVGARAGVRGGRAGFAGARAAGRVGRRQPGLQGLAGSRRGLLRIVSAGVRRAERAHAAAVADTDPRPEGRCPYPVSASPRLVAGRRTSVMAQQDTDQQHAGVLPVDDEGFVIDTEDAEERENGLA